MDSRSSACRHPDIRKFDGFTSCLACGTTIFDLHVTETSGEPSPEANPGAKRVCQYRKLNYELGQEIRLLDVMPGLVHDPVKCEIVTVSFLHNPEYEALSYTWATEQAVSSLSRLVHPTDGTTLPVTANCEAAIRRLRRLSL
ncbi:hypothetical protein BU23DRAFT_658546 [Bimuria novae-zelandiae CBS 107.79]|uniref:Heterokaryon incompatibility domain-containing protein n=1 Tax=Bimuria novae-zelandiae CBS 107.79 TaxID=1447943 RepID=A0A6A5USK8_9PLEO|nr:hypothetical protein BU23DRAFT_658546 [Bimuria novae-zelandiae CBS 107.79]